MPRKYARGDNAVGICGRSGRKMLLRDMVFDGQFPNMRVDPEWYEPRHPQEQIVRVNDAVSLYRPSGESRQIEAPVLSLVVSNVNFELSWTEAEAADTMIDRYELWRRVGTGSFQLVSTFHVERDEFGGITSNPLSSSQLVTALDISHSFFIRAYAITGESVDSNTVNGLVSVPALTIDLPMTYDLQQTFSGLTSITTAGLAVAVPDGLVISAGRTRLSGTVTNFSNYHNNQPYSIQLGVKPSDGLHLVNGSSTLLSFFSHEQQSGGVRLEMNYGEISGISATTSMLNKRGRINYRMMGSSTSRPLARFGWRFEWRRHESPLNGQTLVYPQALKVYNGNIVYTVHANDTMTKFYEVNPATGAVLRSCTTTAYPHISGICRSQAGEYYCIDFRQSGGSRLLKFNLEQSLATGSLVVDWEATLRNQDGSMEFFTHAGTNYFCIAQFSLSNVSQLTRIWPVSVLGPSFNPIETTPTKTWTNNGRTQGLRMYGGFMYESNNAASDAANSSRFGVVNKLDIATFMTSGANGASFTTFLTDAWAAPSGYPEELDFDANGRLWIGTESNVNFNDDLDGWCSIWSCPVSELGLPQENHYTFNLSFPSPGNVTANVYINASLFETRSQTHSLPTATSSTIRVGLPNGLNVNTEDYASHFDGFVRRLHMRATQINTAIMKYVADGNTEPDALTAHTVPIVNPGGESGVTGWTNEIGGLANRSTSPSPRSGSSYFFGGPNLETLVRQRFDLLSVTGLANQTALNNAQIRGYVKIWQAAFSSTDDDVQLGVRWLDSSLTQLSFSESDRSRPAEPQQWFARHVAVNANSGSRYMDITIRMNRNAGTNNDGYVDDVTATVYRI